MTATTQKTPTIEDGYDDDEGAAIRAHFEAMDRILALQPDPVTANPKPLRKAVPVLEGAL